MKKFVLAFLLSTSAFAKPSTASFGLKFVGNNEVNDNVVGLSLAQPLWLGMGYWTWMGIGSKGQESKWAENTHAMDFSLLGNTTITAAVTMKQDLVSDKFSHEYSAGIKVKLW